MNQPSIISESTPFPDPPAAIRWFALLLCALVALSAIGGIVLGAIGRDWFLLAFEVCALLAGVLTGLTMLRVLREAPALALLCAGGVVFVGAVLSEPQLATSVLGSSTNVKSVAGVTILPYVYARIAIGLIFVALAGLVIGLRSPGRTARYTLTGVGLAVPVVGIASLFALPGPRVAILAMPGPLLLMLSLIGALVVIGFLATSAHCLIRAFDPPLPGEAA